jgi:polyisoprenoid-binding protein YceI
MAHTKWVIDPTHSELVFKVKHLMITNVQGEFRKFHAEIEGEDFRTSPVKVTIDAASLFTNNDDRDAHLRSADFFETEQFPELIFTGSSFQLIEDDHYRLKGELSIRGIGREVVLDVEYGGINKDPWGNEKAGFSLSGKISRKEWGLNWNAALEAGGVLVSDEVRIHGEIQFVKVSQ